MLPGSFFLFLRSRVSASQEKQGPRAKMGLLEKVGEVPGLLARLVEGIRAGVHYFEVGCHPCPPPSEVELQQVPGTLNPPNSPTFC